MQHLNRICLTAAVLAPAASLTLAQRAQAVTPPDTLIMSTRITTSQGKERPQVQTGTVWLKGGKMKAQTGDTITVVDNKEQLTYNLKDPRKVLLAFPIQDAQKANNLKQRLAQVFNSSMMKGMKKVGTATLLGHPTTIYQVKPPGSGDSNTRVWVADDLGVPIPLKLQITGAFNLTNEVTGLKVNPPIPDGYFKAPSGFTRQERATPPMPGVPDRPHT